MSKKIYYSLFVRQSFELCFWFCILNLIFVLPLILGQLLRLRRILWPLNYQLLAPVLSLVQSGTLVLFEITIPLALLFAIIIMVRRWLRQGLYVAWSSLGGSAKLLLIPIILIAFPCVLAMNYCSHNLTPNKLVEASLSAESLMQNRWRALMPTLVREQLITPKSTQKNDFSESSLQSTWLFSSHDNKKSLSLKNRSNSISTFHLFSCDQKEQACLSAWWKTDDEQQTSIILRDLELFYQEQYLHIDTFTFPRPHLDLDRIHKTFGPPNSLLTKDLGNSVHHRFIAEKRDALSLSPLPFALIAVYLSLRFSFYVVLIGASGLVMINFGLLRSLELVARAGYISAELAAWTPICLLLILSLIAWFKFDHLSPNTSS